MAYQVRRRRRDEETALSKSPRAKSTPKKTRRAPPQTPDSKKEEFRKYLEKSGVIDALTKGGGRRPEWCVRPHVSVRCLSLFARARSRGRRVVDDVAAPPRAVLVGLYEEPERPPNAVDYIKRYMGAPTGIDVEALRQENENARRAASRFDAFSPLPCVPASATAATRPWSTAACRAPAFRPPRFRAPAFARFRRRPPRSFGRNAKTSVRRSTS